MPQRDSFSLPCYLTHLEDTRWFPRTMNYYFFAVPTSISPNYGKSRVSAKYRMKINLIILL